MVSRRKYKFTLDKKRLEEVCLSAHNAYKNREGIFRDFKKFLPQWNIPSELEFAPQRIEVKDPLQASLYLWTCVFFERANKSSTIIRNALRTWYNPKTRWIFDPKEVIKHTPSEIEILEHNLFSIEKKKSKGLIGQVLKNSMQFNLQSTNENSPEVRFYNNAQRLISEYDGDPRNLIRFNTVSQARENLMQFEGIGSGIANLFIIYMLHRNIVLPRDPKNALLKIDIHKGRIPVNTDSVKPLNGEIARDESYATELEKAYNQISKKNGIPAEELDDALWIIGSEMCARQDYNKCSGCPFLEKLCTANCAENQITGRYDVYSPDKNRIDVRRNKGQPPLIPITI